MPEVLNLSYLWFALTIPALLVLYLLKIKRRDRTVASVLFWSAVKNELEANRPFRRLKRNLLMLLQILFLLLGVVALIRPVFWRREFETRNVIMLFDLSASMKADEGGVTRFELARREALKLIGVLDPDDRMMLIGVGDEPEIIATFTSDKNALTGKIAGLGPRDVGTNYMRALGLAKDRAAGMNGCDVFLIGDGCAEFEDPGFGFRMIKVGGARENLGIDAVDVQPVVKDGKKMSHVFVAIANYGREEHETTVSLYVEGALVDSAELRLGPGERREIIFSDIARTGQAEVRIDAADALAIDNSAWLTLFGGEPLVVGLLGPANGFLEQALHAIDDIEIYRAQPGDDLECDLLIANRTMPEKLPRAACLLIRPDGTFGPFTFGGAFERPEITTWDRSDPLMRFMDFADVHVLECGGVAGWQREDVLLGSDRAPLILAYRRADAYLVAMNFDLDDTNFCARLSFPLFILNLVREATAFRKVRDTRVYRAGEEIRFAGLENPVIEAPGGGRVKLERAGGEHSVRLYAAGAYRLRDGDAETAFAVNFIDPRESDLAADRRMDTADGKILLMKSVETRPNDIYIWLVLAALAVLTLEWLLYHRCVY